MQVVCSIRSRLNRYFIVSFYLWTKSIIVYVILKYWFHTYKANVRLKSYKRVYEMCPSLSLSHYTTRLYRLFLRLLFIKRKKNSTLWRKILLMFHPVFNIHLQRCVFFFHFTFNFHTITHTHITYTLLIRERLQYSPLHW